MSNEEFMQRVIIAVLPECIRYVKPADETIMTKQACSMAFSFAKAIAEKLGTGGEPEELKIKKGEWYCCTQNMIDSVGCTIFTIGKMYRSYEDGYLLDNYAHQAKIDIIANKYFEHIENGEAILSIPERTGNDCEDANSCNISKEIAEMYTSLHVSEDEGPLDNGLDEEIRKYIEPLNAHDIQIMPFTRLVKCAYHFANWKEKQMIKDALTTDVKGYVGGDGIYIHIDLPIHVKVNEGDNVKVIIVKEVSDDGQ